MGNLVDGPDTSSFTAFTYSLLSFSESGNSSKDEQIYNQEQIGDASSDTIMKENGARKSLLSRGRQSLRALYQATRIGYRTQDREGISNMRSDDVSDAKLEGPEMRHLQNVKKQASGELPGTSEPSLLLTEKTRNALYASLPALVQGRKWLLLYSKFLAIGGGGHFALYQDGDVLNGSSSFTETYGNPCLAFSEDFEVKEIELWGFAYGSKYEEILAETPGICRW